MQDKHVQAGDFITVVCSLKAGDPPVSFDWIKDGDPASSLLGVRVANQEFSSTLTILTTTSIHAGDYFCKASNPVSWSVKKTRVFINGTLGLILQ